MKNLNQKFDELMFGIVEPEIRSSLIPKLLKAVEKHNEELMEETIKEHCQDKNCACKELII